MNKSAVALFAALSAVLSLAGCGQNHRFGADPPIVYPTDHTKSPVILSGKYGASMSGTFVGDPRH